MPGPTTEVLADDREEVRGDLHKIAGEADKLSAGFNPAKWFLGLDLAATHGDGSGKSGTCSSGQE